MIWSKNITHWLNGDKASGSHIGAVHECMYAIPKRSLPCAKTCIAIHFREPLNPQSNVTAPKLTDVRVPEFYRCSHLRWTMTDSLFGWLASLARTAVNRVWTFACKVRFERVLTKLCTWRDGGLPMCVILQVRELLHAWSRYLVVFNRLLGTALRMRALETATCHTGMYQSIDIDVCVQHWL